MGYAYGGLRLLRMRASLSARRHALNREKARFSGLQAGCWDFHLLLCNVFRASCNLATSQGPLHAAESRELLASPAPQQPHTEILPTASFLHSSQPAP